MDRALLLSKQGLGGNEALAVQCSLLLPGVLLIGALSSQGVVSKSFCHISMGLLLPTGRRYPGRHGVELERQCLFPGLLRQGSFIYLFF